MDTRFWGPSGWKLLHLITFADESNFNKKAICDFFELLPYVLPCKFCRASLSEYTQKMPIDCRSPLTLQKWLWQIHNMVNAKLRTQNLPTAPDPSFEEVRAIYTEKYNQGCSRTSFDGWDFLFSVADNHPMSQISKASVPMPGAPPEHMVQDPLERNRWNLMVPEERLIFYKQFWRLLPEVLPYPEWRQVWAAVPGKKWSTRKLALQSLWKVRSALEAKLELVNRTNYSNLCKVLQDHRSSCQKSRRSKTCRKKRTNK
jgi:hypothetical protein